MQDSMDNQALTLMPADASVVRLVQITDCHILADAGECLQGMNTRDSFEAVCAAAVSDNPGFDLVLATGDLSQDASAASYQYLAEKFDALELPVFWLPGNHDDDSLMHQHLRGKRISAAKQVLIGNWLIVLLDSTIKGEIGGALSHSQLEFLEKSLHLHANRHALVCLHHQPQPAGSEWIDQSALQQPRQLNDLLRAQANVKAVLWGHVHQQAHHQRDNIEWMSTPSSCVQFKPASKTFALDDLPPGYRELSLHVDGRIDTAVRRLVDFDIIHA